MHRWGSTQSDRQWKTTVWTRCDHRSTSWHSAQHAHGQNWRLKRLYARKFKYLEQTGPWFQVWIADIQSHRATIWTISIASKVPNAKQSGNKCTKPSRFSGLSLSGRQISTLYGQTTAKSHEQAELWPALPTDSVWRFSESQQMSAHSSTKDGVFGLHTGHKKTNGRNSEAKVLSHHGNDPKMVTVEYLFRYASTGENTRQTQLLANRDPHAATVYPRAEWGYSKSIWPE